MTYKIKQHFSSPEFFREISLGTHICFIFILSDSEQNPFPGGTLQSYVTPAAFIYNKLKNKICYNWEELTTYFSLMTWTAQKIIKSVKVYYNMILKLKKKHKLHFTTLSLSHNPLSPKHCCSKYYILLGHAVAQAVSR
jgi:hypothetical protein